MSQALNRVQQFRPQVPADPFEGEGYTGYPDCLMVAASGLEDRQITEEERVRLGRMVSTSRQKEMRSSFVLRRRLVADLTGANEGSVNFGAHPEGAPFLISPTGWAVTLANKGLLTVVAIADEPAEIGVDLELMRPLDWQPMLSMICDASERQAFEDRFTDRDDAIAAFFRMWTLKEAVLKTTLKGFRAGPKAVDTMAALDSASGAGELDAFDHVFKYWTVMRGDAVISLVQKRL